MRCAINDDIHFPVNVENANTFLNISKYEQPYSKCITIFPFFAFRAIVPRVYRDISFHVRDNGRFEIEVELPITERERERIFITGWLDHGGGKRGFFLPPFIDRYILFGEYPVAALYP